MALPRAPAAHPDGAPPGHTGGFGEPTCAECHFDAPVNPSDGSLSVEVVPAGSAAWALRVRLRADGMARGGFQLSVRSTDEAGKGGQVGTLLSPGERVAVTDSAGIQYATHTAAGNGPAAGDSLVWEVLWAPPGREPGQRFPSGGRDSVPLEGQTSFARGTVLVIHVAANAANDDASPFGDRVFTARRCWRPGASSGPSPGASRAAGPIDPACEEGR